MFAKHVLFTTGMLLGLVLLGAVAQTDPAVENRPSDQPKIVARIGDEVITEKEFTDTLNSLNRFAPPGSDETAFRTQILEQMVKTEILYVLAKQAKFSVSDEEVKAEIDNALKRAPSPEAFDEYLQSRGITREEFTESVRKKMVTQKFVEEKTKDVQVSEEDIVAEFNRAKEAGQLDVVDVSHILARVTDDTPEADANAKKKVETARERIVKGEDFAAVAREVSEDPGSAQDGGKYENVARGVMVPEFDRLAFELPVGELSQPFRTQFGWHILKVADRGTLTLDETHDQAKEVLLRQKKMQLLEQLIDEGKKTIKVEILLDDNEDSSKAATSEQSS